jgi:proline iminopeptidase
LRGIYLGSEEDNQWVAEKGGVQRLYPDLWRDYISIVPPEKRDHLMKYYYSAIRSSNPEEQRNAVLEWENYEERLSSEITPPRMTLNDVDEHLISAAVIETEYFLNHLFLEPDQLIKRVNRIRHIPAIIVHGRHDMLCPLDNAYQLHEAWPEARFFISEGAGHSAYDSPNLDRLVEAADHFKTAP